MISLDFAKNVMASKDDDFNTNVHLVIKRIIFTFALFLVPTVVEFMLSLVSDASNNFSGEYQSCLDNLAYIEYYEALYEEKKEQEEKEWEEYLAQLNADEVFKKSVPSYTVSSGNNGSNGITMGQKYQLTDEQLKDVASVCHREQGGYGIEAVKAEASLLVNWFEIYKGGTNFYDSMQTTFFFKGYAHGDERPTPSQEEIDAVKSVIVLGKRNIPLYVDEHDSVGDIAYVTDGNGGHISDINDPSQYVPNKSIVQQNGNIDGAGHYTYYFHPNLSARGSDPFGYTDHAKSVVQSRNS